MFNSQNFREIAGGLVQVSEVYRSAIITIDARGTVKAISVRDNGAVQWSAKVGISENI